MSGLCSSPHATLSLPPWKRDGRAVPICLLIVINSHSHNVWLHLESKKSWAWVGWLCWCWLQRASFVRSTEHWHWTVVAWCSNTVRSSCAERSIQSLTQYARIEPAHILFPLAVIALLPISSFLRTKKCGPIFFNLRKNLSLKKDQIRSFDFEPSANLQYLRNYYSLNQSTADLFSFLQLCWVLRTTDFRQFTKWMLPQGVTEWFSLT